MTVHERCVGDVTIIDVGGRITEDGAEALRALVQPLVRQGRVKIVFDLQETPYIDTTALGEIVRAHTSATRGGGGLKLLHVRPKVHTLLTITRLDAAGNPLPAGSTATPSFVRFDGVTGHFSTFAVVIVSGTSNSPPHAVADAATLTTGTSVMINVLANDSDPNGDHLTVTSVTQPASGHGTVTINTNGTLTYTQTVFVNGTETFTYTIGDGHDGTATATVTVTIKLSARIGIDMLRSQVQHAGLRRGVQLSLDCKLRAAQQALAKGNSRAAANLLNAFANEVRALKRARLLPASLADLWLLENANILSEIGRR